MGSKSILFPFGRNLIWNWTQFAFAINIVTCFVLFIRIGPRVGAGVFTNCSNLFLWWLYLAALTLIVVVSVLFSSKVKKQDTGEKESFPVRN